MWSWTLKARVKDLLYQNLGIYSASLDKDLINGYRPFIIDTIEHASTQSAIKSLVRH